MTALSAFFLGSALSLSPSALAAPLSSEPSGSEQRLEIHEKGTNAFRFTVRYELETHDGCNTFGLMGDLKDRGYEEEGRAMEADLAVTQTQIYCPDLAEPRSVSVESQIFEINGGGNRVDVVLYVPEGMTIHRR